ncbi:hypothetical protein [Brevibacillus agri]|uniref:hypothetical protein n=1 Tax=Brevibacillus agri TaxID=51101 RepID=UPI0028682074|nr:hypothetical protein [Brevibacillus agri]
MGPPVSQQNDHHRFAHSNDRKEERQNGSHARALPAPLFTLGQEICKIFHTQPIMLIFCHFAVDFVLAFPTASRDIREADDNDLRL